jgi:hypothetical protein
MGGALLRCRPAICEGCRHKGPAGIPAPAAEEGKLAEIRQELGFSDLAATDVADPKITRVLVTTLTTVLERTVQTWQDSAAELAPFFADLREDGDIAARSALLIEMKARVREAWDPRLHLGW